MPSDDLSLDSRFRDFISAYQRANQRDQAQMADQLRAWMEQWGIAEAPKDSHPASPLPDLATLDPPLLLENDYRLSQFADHIEQVIWVRDLHSGEILYVSPTYESIWGRSCESLVAHPNTWIETVHPEDRVQVMVSVPSGDRQPVYQQK